MISNKIVRIPYSRQDHNYIFMLDFKKQITQGGQLISFKLERYIGKGGERGLREIKRKNERCGAWDGVGWGG